jgi:hypothetical protein
MYRAATQFRYQEARNSYLVMDHTAYPQCFSGQRRTLQSFMTRHTRRNQIFVLDAALWLSYMFEASQKHFPWVSA